MKKVLTNSILSALIAVFGITATFGQNINVISDLSSSIALEDYMASKASPDQKHNTKILKLISQKLKAGIVIPESMRDFIQPAEGLVRLELNSAGEIENVKLIHSLGTSLDKRIIDAAYEIDRLEPFKLNGENATRTVEIPIHVK